MDDRELLEYIAAQVGNLTQKVDSIDKKVDNLDKRVQDVENGQRELKKIVICMEQGHGQKLDALFDGYKQNNDRLDRIEKQVSNQEEFILKRVK